MTTRPLVRRLLVTVAGVLALVAGLAVAPQPTTAQAADLRQFDPGMIISDALFYDGGTMSATTIQQFLDEKGSRCSPAAGNTCLKDYRQATTTRAADRYCGAYAGTASESAAQIIAKVATVCGINPQVLLVTLQKEQGLVTATAGKSAAVYSKALGFGCPDGAPCEQLYSGFGNQVYLAARQFKLYAADPSRYGHRAGMTNQVLYHPNRACGSSAVFIQNQATASLYNYTPYQPNAAALAAGYGSGDACSSYGNRNFWNYFTDWFGSTTQRAPFGSIDRLFSPASGQIAVTGWALDPDTDASIDVHVYVDGRATRALTADESRPDIGALHGRGDAHGYATTIGAAAGQHQVCVYALDSTGGPSASLGCGTVAVVNQQPVGALDGVAAAGVGSVRVQGWALDPDTTASIKVHVYVDGRYDRQLVAGGSRPDVGRAYGLGDAHGVDATFALRDGTHQVCLYAIDATGGANPQLGCRSVTVNNKAPIGSLDEVGSVQGKIHVRGWGLDPDTTDSIYLHVYVDGTYQRSVRATGDRPDVAAAYGKGAAHGLDTTLDAAPGRHEVCLYAIDATGGGNPRLGCQQVVVVNAKPVGAFDSGLTGLGELTVNGWVLDPDTSDSTYVHVYLDGAYSTSVRATLPRQDVAAAYGKGAAHGFSVTRTASVGPHQVCLYAIDSWGGSNTALGCKTVEVNGTPFGYLDGAVVSGTGAQVRGWTIDPNTTGPVEVHVYVDGKATKSLTADVPRPDVQGAYGMGDRHGYDVVVPGVRAGQQVCVYAIDTFGPSKGGINPLLGCSAVAPG